MFMEGFSFSTSPPLKASDWKIGALLGEGSFARVHRAQLIATGDEFALKVVDATKLQRYERTDEVLTERRVLALLPAHPHVVRLHHSFRTDKSFFLAMELLPGGELLGLSRPHGLRLSLLPYYLSQILAALQHVHAHEVVYRDLKPENCCLTSEGRLKLVDFGSAKLVDKLAAVETTRAVAREFVGTPQYMSPEAVANSLTTSRSDFWSLGALLCHLLSGHAPFEGGSEFLTLRRVQTARYELPEATPAPFADLVRRLLVLTPHRRLDARGVWGHAALAGSNSSGSGGGSGGSGSSSSSSKGGGSRHAASTAGGDVAVGMPPPPTPEEAELEAKIQTEVMADAERVVRAAAERLDPTQRSLLAFELGRRGLLHPSMRVPLGLPATPPPPVTDYLAAALGTSGDVQVSIGCFCWRPSRKKLANV